MIIQCSKCQKKYKIDSEKVTEKGVKVTCQNCGNVLLVRKRPEDGDLKDATPCSVCGHPAAKGLDTDAPLCERCYEIEQQKAQRFVEFTKPKSGPATQERELDLAGGKDVSFGSISEGDFSPEAYSTGVLPDEGKGYVPPERVPLKSMVGGDEPVNFEDMSPDQKQDTTPPSSSRLGADQPAVKAPTPASPRPASPQKTSPTPPPGAKPSPQGAPPRPVPKSATPASGTGIKPSSGGVSVKDATPPPIPARPLDPTPPPTPGGGKKMPPKAEAISLEEVKDTDVETLSVTPALEVTPLDIPEEQEIPKRASIFPLILSLLLLITLVFYFLLKFTGLGSL